MPATYDSASAIVAEAATGHYLFHIKRYSQMKEMPPTRCFLSHIFVVGDCSWRMWFCPNGAHADCAGYTSVFVALDESITGSVKARAVFSLLDQAGKPVPNYHSRSTPLEEYSAAGIGHGFDHFIEREGFEKSNPHLVDDRFTIRCDVTLFRRIRTEDRSVTPLPQVVVPPPHLHQHLGDLLESRVGADVTFQVAGETFAAHKCILAARSPVFKAELVRTTGTGVCVRVDDMEAHVFKALLHFVYTDSLPEITEQEEGAMAEHMLVAADRYGMHRLKLICAEKLAEHVGLGTVATILVLAENYRCHRLKKACIDFLKCPPALDVVMALGDGFDHVIENCPALLRELWDIWFEDDPIQDDLALSL
ncbi:hypothetical protein PR202_ga07406 [Eleusine coracana subsp. coracana]|uniref:Uncharacterized protein n=1 Tax=Eleusine coracana subsp. coracana TaxID=191504 RepID=A0AAV5BXH7_ELECO|nr:hypothetical protein QOZ80_2AG0111760 [Eleusine coracana subsp. coracana]GJM91066.1 hypothetical protein PR202_ga07406 [Eleusine coracana subsp. coracana]